MANDGKTEAPTPKRKRDARKKGQVARSGDLGNGIGLFGIAIMVPVVLPRLGHSLAADWELATARAAHASTGGAADIAGSMMTHAAVTLAPLVVVVGGAGLLSALAMAGKPNPYQLKPKWERVSPKQGIKRLVGKQVLWELGRTAAKLTLLGLVVWVAITHALDRLLTGPRPLTGALESIGTSTQELIRWVGVLALAIGLADAIVSKRRHLKSLKMTKKELTDEHRHSEGNPLVKGEIRRRQQKMSRLRMMAEVATADVVVTNPTHFAVALRYEPGQAAPTVVAKGADDTALRIREEARKWGVPVKENKAVARALFRACEPGDTIPVELYVAVAEILAVVLRTRRAGGATIVGPRRTPVSA